MSTYKCQLCFTDENMNKSRGTGSFIKHLIGVHNSPKARNMLETLKIFGTEKEEYIIKELDGKI